MADLNKCKEDIKTFYGKLKDMGGIRPVWEKVLEVIRSSCDYSETDDGLKVFCMYFSLLDDGNICISLNPEKLLKQWLEKWSGLCLASEPENFKNDEDRSKAAEQYKTAFTPIIRNGIASIKENAMPAVIGDENKLFVIRKTGDEEYLFADRYFEAKISIERRIRALFPAVEKPALQEADYKAVIDFFAGCTELKGVKEAGHVILEKEQAEVIIRGLKANLIVTGGPGTGKTTALCYLLWNLLKEKDDEGIPYLNYNLYLSAPSAKAAARMKESISDSLNDFKDEEIQKPENAGIYDKLATAEPYTIHRLLSYSPKENGFRYNAGNKFEEKSIFIIDEASMVDIMLFKSLLEAIPDKARLFILGDKDQLPSVQAGAVLGELLSKRKKSVVELTVSKRFNEDSEVGKLKNFIEKPDAFPDDGTETKYGTWLSAPDLFSFSRKSVKERRKENPVFFYPLRNVENKRKDLSKREQMNVILDKWSTAFCNDLPALSSFDRNDPELEAKLKKLWYLANEAKILCAERRGFRGVEEVNERISGIVCKKAGVQPDDEGYYSGQPLIMTLNQEIFRLYNGDTGIVVSFNDREAKYFMVEKKAGSEEAASASAKVSENDLLFRVGNFMFYQLSMLPKESLETGYAITIHKSQGSGYENILIVLPEQTGHPLLNRQIVYTAVTRTKLNTYIIASVEALNYAKKTLIERQTMIELED